MLALAAPLASAAPLRFSYNFLLAPHSPVIPAHLKFPYRSCPPTRPAPASAQPSFCAGFAAQKLLIRFGEAREHDEGGDEPERLVPVVVGVLTQTQRRRLGGCPKHDFRRSVLHQDEQRDQPMKHLGQGAVASW